MLVFSGLLGSFRWSGFDLCRRRLRGGGDHDGSPHTSFATGLKLGQAEDGSGDLAVEGYFIAEEELVGADG